MVRGFVFDMDGTLVVGKADGGGYRLLPGVRPLIESLRERRLPFLVFTNGTAQSPAHYAAHLAEAGLTLEPGQMMTPSSVAADHFLASGLRRILLLGIDGTGAPLRDAGLEIIRPGDSGPIDAVYVGWHPGFGMADLQAAIDAVLIGAPFYVSSDVPFFFTSSGRALGVSRLIAAAITSATGRRPRVLGKPASLAARVSARRLGCRASELAIIGDDPRLEIVMARRVGAIGIAVTTGLTDRAGWAAQPPGRTAHRIVDRLEDLVPMGLLDGRIG
jgi:NagD protein